MQNSVFYALTVFVHYHAILICRFAANFMETPSTYNPLQVSITNRQILGIALPITIALVVPQLNFITNNIFLGSLGQKELGNAGITGVYYLIVAVVGNGLNNAIQSLISRNAGKGDIKAIDVTLMHGIRIALLFALAGIAFTWLVTPYLLKPFAAAESFAAEMQFLKIRVLGLPFLYLFQMGNAFLVGTLNSRFLMLGTIIEAGANILFDYLFIFGHAGFPQFGFNGAAVASVIAEALGLLAVTGVIFSLGLKRKFHLFSNTTFNKKANKSIIQLASPLVLQYVISLTTWLVFFVMIEGYGERAKAISNTMRNVFGVVGIFIWAFASTTNTMVSNLIGQQKQDKVLYAIKRVMLLSFLFASVAAILLNLFPHLFFSIFAQGEDFITDAIPVMRMVTAGMLCMSVASVWLNGLTGTGQTRINVLVEIAAIVLYLIYNWIIIYQLKWSLTAAWANEIVYWAVIFIIAFTYLRSEKWKHKIML